MSETVEDLTEDMYTQETKAERENKDSAVWRCTSRSKQVKCPVILKQNEDAFVQKNGHLHPACSDRELKMNVYSKVRTTSCNQVYRPAMAKVEDAILEFIDPYQNTAHLKKKLLKRVANRARAALRPAEPKTLDFEIDRKFLNADEFVLSDIRYDGHRHITFMTNEQMALLKSAKRWYMDGTFKVLRSLQEKIGHHSLEGLVLDYEQGAWQAVHEVFPTVQVKGCAFHWSQVIWRHVQQLGLAETYRLAFVYPDATRPPPPQFLPSVHIQRAFEMLAERATTTATTALIDSQITKNGKIAVVRATTMD